MVVSRSLVVVVSDEDFVVVVESSVVVVSDVVFLGVVAFCLYFIHCTERSFFHL